MPSPKRPEWAVRIYGQQLQNIDVDLVAQIVVIMGREMMAEDTKEEKGEDVEREDT